MNLGTMRARLSYEAFIEARFHGRTEDARRHLSRVVAENAGLAYRIAGMYARGELAGDRAALRQAALEGLAEAIQKFDPEKSKLSTYADYWIRHRLRGEIDFLRSRIYRIPSGRRLTEAQRIVLSRLQGEGVEPTAELVGCHPLALEAHHTTRIGLSIDEPVSGGRKFAFEGGEDHPQSLAEVLSADLPTVDEDIDRARRKARFEVATRGALRVDLEAVQRVADGEAKRFVELDLGLGKGGYEAAFRRIAEAAEAFKDLEDD